MAVTIDWQTYVIYIPQSYLTLVGGTIYELDTEQFRLDLKALESSIYGMGHPKTHNHNTTVTVAGTTYARAIEILFPYSVEFEDGQYTVILKGSNNNIFDVSNGILVQNQVQIISTNAAGLIVTTVGSGVTEQDKLDIADRVWDELVAQHPTVNTFGGELANKDDLSSITITGITASVDVNAIADAVWDESIIDHNIADTFGAKNQNKVPSENIDDYKSALTLSGIVNAIWEESISSHVNTGTFGKELVKVDDLSSITISGVTADVDINAIADAIWNSQITDYTISGTYGVHTIIESSGTLSNIEYLKQKVDVINILTQFISDLESGKQVLINNQLVCYKPDNTTELIRFNLFDSSNAPTTDNVYRRERI